MPKSKKKGKKRKGGKKGKKKQKVLIEVHPPPLHHLTELYNKLREAVIDLKKTSIKARKKRLEGWQISREMMKLNHDNDIYRGHMQEKLEDLQRTIDDILSELEEEKSEVDKIVKAKTAEIDRRIRILREKISKGEQELIELRQKLSQYDTLIKEFNQFQVQLKELKDKIPAAELDANVKTRHLKNQFLVERAKLHNHLERELWTLITTLRSHLMPILADHMNFMDFENKCHRWDLSRLDINNNTLSKEKERLLERRNKLMVEKDYIPIEWALNKLTEWDAKRKAAYELARNPPKPPEPQEECALSVAFKTYFNKRLKEARLQQLKNEKLWLAKIKKEEQLEIEQENAERETEERAKKAKAVMENLITEEAFEQRDFEEALDDDGLEYYLDDDDNLYIAPKARMMAHLALMENRELGEYEFEEEQGEYEEEAGEEEVKAPDSGSGSARSSGSSGGSDV